MKLPRKLPAVPGTLTQKLPTDLKALPGLIRQKLPHTLASLPRPAFSRAAPAHVPTAIDTERPRRQVLSLLAAPFRIINWRIVTAALFGVGILHIVATLAAPQLAIATAFDRLEGVLPVNRSVILPPIGPGAQPLPFLSPALRYVMCRFDARQGPVEVSVVLDVAGSSLTIYSIQGEAIYTAAQSAVAQHRVRIVPNDGRFLGLTPEAQGRQNTEVPSATLHAQRGIVVFAVPERGAAYRIPTERQLASATCARGAGKGS